jgi:hypothetical protein
MTETIQISAKNLGQLALPKFLPPVLLGPVAPSSDALPVFPRHLQLN